MKIYHLIAFNAILWIALGIGFALYGPLMLAFFGTSEIPSGNVLLYWFVASFARLLGAALFGFGLLLFAIRSLFRDPSLMEIRRGIVFALLLANLMGIIVAITQQMSVWLSMAGWFTVGIFGIFLLGYSYFMIRGQV